MVDTMAMLAGSYTELASFALVYVAEAHAGVCFMAGACCPLLCVGSVGLADANWYCRRCKFTMTHTVGHCRTWAWHSMHICVLLPFAPAPPPPRLYLFTPTPAACLLTRLPACPLAQRTSGPSRAAATASTTFQLCVRHTTVHWACMD